MLMKTQTLLVFVHFAFQAQIAKRLNLNIVIFNKTHLVEKIRNF